MEVVQANTPALAASAPTAAAKSGSHSQGTSPMRCYTGLRLTGRGVSQNSYALSECSSGSACMDVEAPVVLGTSTKGNLTNK